jgi:O-antigen/teichoic acid export membrane protein
MAAGTLVVALGLTVTGVGTVAMMALSARSMPATEYAAFAVWWTVATLLGTSFGVFEAYLARLLIGELAAGRSPDGVTGLMFGRALLVIGALCVVMLCLVPILAGRLFADHAGAAVLLPLFTAIAAMQALQRGAATGRHDFAAIAAQLSTDGLARIAIVGVLVLVGADTVTTLAIACVVAAAASLLIGGWRIGPWLASPRLRGSEAAVKPLVFLLLGSVGPLLANNGSVPWLAATHSVDAYTLGAFAGAVTLSRIPTQFVAAVFSPLLAHLAQTVEDDDAATFRHLRRSAEVAAAGLGILYVLMFAVLGPWLLSVYLGPRYELDVLVLVVLAAASSGMFVVVVQQAGLAALDRWARIAVAWGIGTVAFIATLAAPGDTLLRATAAPLFGVLTAMATMAGLGRGLWGAHNEAADAGPGEETS